MRRRIPADLPLDVAEEARQLARINGRSLANVLRYLLEVGLPPRARRRRPMKAKEAKKAKEARKRPQ